jgi:hypothetical protein
VPTSAKGRTHRIAGESQCLGKTLGVLAARSRDVALATTTATNGLGGRSNERPGATGKTGRGCRDE